MANVSQLLNYRRTNLPMVIRTIGWLLLIEAFFMIFPTVTCVIYDEADVIPFGASTAFTAITGFVLTRCVRPDHATFGKRDGYLLTAAVWVVYSTFGMLPFIFSVTPITISDAFFEAMSGFTTTGASVLDSIDHMSHGIHIWRAMMQWIGGMGIILFTLAVIPMFNRMSGVQMFQAEVTGITIDKIRPRISSMARMLWLIYLVLTAVLVMLLWAGPMSLFESVCHAFGAISTGGFSTQADSIAHYNSDYINIVITMFMFLGGVNFVLIYRCVTGKLSALHRNDVFQAYLFVIAVMYVLFVVAIVSREGISSWREVTIYPLFQIISTLTSTGYSCTDYESWGPFTLSLMFVMMFFGACAGSTSGGAKIDRILFLFKNVRNELYRCIYPSAVLGVRINGKVMSPALVSKVIAFLCIFVLLIMAGGLGLTAMGIPLIDAFFSAFSCLCNTGLGAGVTGYGSSYEIIPDAGKWLLSFLMLVGRLEIFTVLIILSRSFWRR